MPDKEFFKLWTEIIRTGIKYAPQIVPISLGPSYLKVKCLHCNEVMEFNNFDINCENYYFIWMLPIPPNKYFFCKLINCRICGQRFYVMSKLFGIYRNLIFLYLTPVMARIYLKYIVLIYRKINPLYRPFNALRYKIKQFLFNAGRIHN